MAITPSGVIAHVLIPPFLFSIFVSSDVHPYSVAYGQPRERHSCSMRDSRDSMENTWCFEGIKFSKRKLLKGCDTYYEMLSLKYCVYRIRNLLNGKMYVGITKDFQFRMYQHAHPPTKGSKSKYAFPSAVRKYGWECFETEILIENISYEDAKLLEIFCISSYDSTVCGNGYNMTIGGESSINPATNHGYNYNGAFERLGVSDEREYDKVMGKIYREKNHEKILKREKKYRVKNREVIREREKNWYDKNKEKVKIKTAEYRANNHEKVLESKRKYRAWKSEKKNFLKLLGMCFYTN